MDTTTKSLKGTRTAAALADAYVSESTAVTRYTYYAQTAQKEQYFQVANVFNETAANELHHAKIFLKYLTDGGVATSGVMTIDSGDLSNTVNNLKTAAAEELSEGVEQYTKAAEIAEEEGFSEIADRFRAIAAVEKHHRERFELLCKQ